MGIISRGSKTNGERPGTTVIAAGTRLVGSLALSDSFHLDGAMEGTLESKGDVSIGQSGEFEGDIRAKRVLVSGNFNGNLDCERLEIVATGRVTGEIDVRELVIESGGHFSGASRIKDEQPQRQLSHQKSGQEDNARQAKQQSGRRHNSKQQNSQQRQDQRPFDQPSDNQPTGQGHVAEDAKADS